ncbi:Protein transport protein Sec31A [Nymphon striatum]|nr:Protein transport protein Sec31A [Nymphon striatum]
MKVKEVDRTANIAWSPAAQHPIYLAAGTAAQQLDATFSTTAALEIYGLNLTEPGLDMSLKGSIVSEHRFHNIAWGCHEVTSSDKDTTGVIVGGADDGNLIVYDPSKILQGNKGIIFQKNNHNGPVRTLDFNPHKPNLLASGSSESEIFIWDLLHPVKPMTPGTKSQPLEDVACVAWNCQVQHILASTFPGKCVVWDLRKNEPIIKVSDTSYRMRCKEIAWHPAVATQLCIASEDDQTPVIQLWDLRFATSPLKVLENHQRGVLSLAWCKQDPDLLISCGKDSRILCWNPNSNVPGGEVVCEINSNQWNFSVAWCERNPAVIASSSFDGYVGIYSLMGGQQQLTPSSKITDAFPGSETLSQPPVNQLPQRNVALPLKKPPKWLRKPVGASFANIFKIDLLESKFTITEFVGLLVMYIRNTSTALLDNATAIKSNFKHMGNDKPGWFDQECCIITRKISNIASRIKSSNNQPQLLTQLNIFKKKYEQLKIKKKAETTEFRINQINKLHPGKKEFWIFFKNKKKQEISGPSVESFERHLCNIFQTSDQTPTQNIIHYELSPSDPLLDQEISEDEIISALAESRGSSSPGLDGISYTFLKNNQQLLTPVLSKLFNDCFQMKLLPPQWNVSKIVMIFKKGNVCDPSNYRPINLLSCLYKLYSRILTKRLSQWCDIHNILSNFQYGFRTGLGTQDALFNITTLIQQSIYKNPNSTIFSTFIDFKMAFDRVNRDILFKKLQLMGISKHFLLTIISTLTNNKFCVHNGTTIFDNNIGVKQGDVISPLLFCLFLNDLPSFLGNYDDLKIEDINQNIILYADDVALFSKSEQSMNSYLHKLHQYCQTNQIQVNIKKSKGMIFSRKTPDLLKFKLIYDNHPLELVTTFKYLGILFDSKMNFKPHFQSLVEKCKFSFNSMLNSDIQLSHLNFNHIQRLIDARLISIINYGANIWGFKRFGGKLVQFSDKQENKVTITQVATDESTMQRSSHLENSLTSRNFADFCTKKLELSPNEYDRTIWSFLLANFEDNPRQKALKLLGYNAEELSKKIQEVLKVEFLNSGVDAEELANRMSTLSAGVSLDFQDVKPRSTLMPEVSWTVDANESGFQRVRSHGKSSIKGCACNHVCGSLMMDWVKLGNTPENSRDVSRDAFDAIGESKSIDGLISRAILVGNIDYAVSLCLQDGRMADALVLAMAGGADLWQQTQQRYLKNSKSDVAKLIAAVVTDSWKQLVVNCDIMYWKEALSAILTYGKQNEFCELCEILGKRLENEKSGELFNKASICYICSGNLEHFVACYSKKNTDENSVQLQDLMEKVMILEKAVEVTQIRPIESIRNGPLLSDKLSGYAKLLANQGQLLSAFSYLSNCNTEEANILKDRIYKSISDYLPGVQPPSFPYRRISLQPSVEPRQAPHIQKNVPRQTNQWSMNKAPTTNNYYGGANQPISEQFMPPHLNNTISSGLYGPPSTSMPNSVPHNVAQSIPSVPPTSISQNLITNSATGPPGPPPPSSSTLPNQKGHMSHRYPSTPQDPSLYSQGYSSVNQANYMSFPQQQNFMQPNAISNSVQNSTSGAMVPNAAHSQPTSNLYNPYMSSPASDTSQFSQVAPPPVSAPYGTSRTDFNLGWNDPPVLTSNVQPIFNPNQPQQPIFNPNQPQDIPNAPVTNQYQNNFAVAPSPMSQLNYGGQNYNAPPQQMQNDQQFIENTEPPLPAAPIEPIPEKHAVIMDVLIALTAKCSNATTNPQMRRKLEDVSRKLENLENKLRYNALSETTLNYLHEMVSHIKCEDYQSAIAVTTNCITRVNFSEISSFMPGIKVLLQVGLQLGIYYSD